MTGLHFEFAPKASEWSWPRIMLIGIFGLAVLAAAALWMDRDRTVGELRMELVRASARPEASARSRPEASSASTSARQAIATLALPLPALLRSLLPPAAVVGNVGVVGLDVLPARNAVETGPRVRVTAHADSLQPAADYFAHLSRLPGASDVQFVRHEYLAERGPAHVQFVIELTWMHRGRS